MIEFIEWMERIIIIKLMEIVKLMIKLIDLVKLIESSSLS